GNQAVQDLQHVVDKSRSDLLGDASFVKHTALSIDADAIKFCFQNRNQVCHDVQWQKLREGGPVPPIQVASIAAKNRPVWVGTLLRDVQVRKPVGVIMYWFSENRSFAFEALARV